MNPDNTLPFISRDPTINTPQVREAKAELKAAKDKLQDAQYREDAIWDLNVLFVAILKRDDAQEIFNDLFKVLPEPEVALAVEHFNRAYRTIR